MDKLPKGHPLYEPKRTAKEQLADYLAEIREPIELAVERLRGETWRGPVMEDERPFIVDVREQLARFLPTVKREDLIELLVPDAEIKTWEDVADAAEELVTRIEGARTT